MEISGIYQIKSSIKPERIYIGSSVDVSKRWKDHTYELRKGTHHSQKLQNHFNKYGESDLQYSLLAGSEKEDLIKMEQYFIDLYKPYFNIAPNAGNTLGKKHRPETITKIRLSKIGKKLSEETRLKMGKHRIGKYHSIETRKKMSLSAMGNKNSKGIVQSKELKEKRSLRMIGNTHGFKKGHTTNVGRRASDETRQKMSIMRSGNNNPNYGKKLSNEARDKMKIAWRSRKLKKTA